MQSRSFHALRRIFPEAEIEYEYSATWEMIASIWFIVEGLRMYLAYDRVHGIDDKNWIVLNKYFQERFFSTDIEAIRHIFERVYGLEGKNRSYEIFTRLLQQEASGEIPESCTSPQSA